MKIRVLGPLASVAGALLVLALFGAMHLLGWRADTCIISGTVPGSGAAADAAVLRGLLYAGAYFGAVVVAPLLIIAAGLQAGWSWLASRRTLTGSASTPRS